MNRPIAPFVRSAVALGVLLTWAFLPDHRDGVVRGLAVGLVVVAAVEFAEAARLDRTGRPAAFMRACAPVLACIVLVQGELEGRFETLAPTFGTLVLVRGIADAIAALTVGSRLGARAWLTCLAITQLAVAIAALTAPDLFGQAVVVLAGLAWLVGGLAAALVSPPQRIRALTMTPVPTQGPMAESERQRIADEVYYDGPDVHSRIVRFVVLLSTATVIAGYGVIQDSTAAVIGAMIIAPLMVPIQALSAGVVSGAIRRAGWAALVLLGGVLLVVVLAMLFAATSRVLPTVLQNSQVTSRTSPTLADLVIALAAGVAGGFALVRRDVAGSLPGVAIAVSLVPPLCVTGVGLAGDDGRVALGSFLLFLVNFVAIVLAVAAVLLLAGYSVVQRPTRHLVAFAVAVGASTLVLAVPLAYIGQSIVLDDTLEQTARTEITRWLQPIGSSEILDLRVSDDAVDALVTSHMQPPPVSELESMLQRSLDRDVQVTIHWVRATELTG